MSKKTDFKQLKKTWYERLAREGFKDIEADEYSLKSPTSKFFGRKHGLVKSGRWEARQQYYYMAEHFLNSYKFDKQLDEIIWEYHSLGLSMRNISRILMDTGVFKISRQTVLRTVKRIRSIMYRAAALERTDETNEQ